MEKNVARLLAILAASAALAIFYYREKIMQLIKQFEGFSATPYPDPPGSGKFSIGYGHQIKPGEHFTSIGEAEAQALLEQDAADARATIDAYITYPLNEAQKIALTSFVYNIGRDQFLQGTVPAKINAGHLAAAAATMKQYIHSGGVVSQDLIDRRAVEAAAFA